MSVVSAPASAEVRTIQVNPVHAAAGLLIMLSVFWRALISQRGFLAVDDFPIIAQADASGLAPSHLFGLYSNHFMPGGRLLTLIVERLAGYQYWPFATLMLLGQALVGVALYRLLRLMLPGGWAVLVPLAMFLFNPMTLEVTAWWAVGVNQLPMQLAMIIAVGAQVRYLRSGERRHLVTLALALTVGLLFFEKALFVAPLVFLVTLCLYAPGGPVRAVWTTLRRWWPSWAVLTGICGLYLALYLSRTTGSSIRRPSSAGEVGTFLAQYFGESVAAGLVGGPWSWLAAGDGSPVAAPQQGGRWISWAVVAVLVAVTVWWRRAVAVRAWTLLALFSALAAGLIAATRLGGMYSGVAGLVPRYLSDVLLVAALCVGVAVCGLRPLDDAAAAARPRVRLSPRAYLTSIAAVVALFIASSVYSGTGFANEWQVKAGRDYLRTAKADLAKVEPGTVFMDQPVPDAVVPRLSAPWNMQSRFFAPLDNSPVFVTQARKLSVFDDAGHVRPAWVRGVENLPGPVPGCGYQVSGGRTVTIPLKSDVINYWQVVRISYLSDRDTSARIRVGPKAEASFDVHRGLNAMFLLLFVGGDQVELTVDDSRANLCTDEIDIGDLMPQPVG